VGFFFFFCFFFFFALISLSSLLPCRNGGKWILRLRKGLASRYWEDLVLAFVGGQFPAGHLCGVVVSVRYQEDIISVWDADASDTAARAEVHATLRTILALPEITQLEYKQHNDSLKDHSSFRNTTRS
jgi:translation initiation factor 4E